MVVKAIKTREKKCCDNYFRACVDDFECTECLADCFDAALCAPFDDADLPPWLVRAPLEDVVLA